MGFAFRPRQARNGRDGTYFSSFLPAMSPEALKAKSVQLRSMRLHRRFDLTLDGLPRWLNPIVAGWMNYYGRFVDDHEESRSAINRIRAAELIR